ncbi:MAG: hypothetical protein PVG86_09505 [Desulfobacterales bacterium]|jgi:hypothetical protein
MKRCCLIILYVVLASCVTHSDNNHNDPTPVSEKNENTLSKELTQQHNSPTVHKLTSILYELAVAPDSDYFAKQHHILLTKGSVKVFISFDSATSISEREAMIQNYDIVIEKTAGNLSRAWVPVNQLIPLSNEPVIQSITLPKRLTPPKDENHE